MCLHIFYKLPFRKTNRSELGLSVIYKTKPYKL